MKTSQQKPKPPRSKFIEELHRILNEYYHPDPKEWMYMENSWADMLDSDEEETPLHENTSNGTEPETMPNGKTRLPKVTTTMTTSSLPKPIEEKVRSLPTTVKPSIQDQTTQVNAKNHTKKTTIIESYVYTLTNSRPLETPEENQLKTAPDTLAYYTSIANDTKQSIHVRGIAMSNIACLYKEERIDLPPEQLPSELMFQWLNKAIALGNKDAEHIKALVFIQDQHPLLKSKTIIVQGKEILEALTQKKHPFSMASYGTYVAFSYAKRKHKGVRQAQTEKGETLLKDAIQIESNLKIHYQLINSYVFFTLKGTFFSTSTRSLLNLFQALYKSPLASSLLLIQYLYEHYFTTPKYQDQWKDLLTQMDTAGLTLSSVKKKLSAFSKEALSQADFALRKRDLIHLFEARRMIPFKFFGQYKPTLDNDIEKSIFAWQKKDINQILYFNMRIIRHENATQAQLSAAFQRMFSGFEKCLGYIDPMLFGAFAYEMVMHKVPLTAMQRKYLFTVKSKKITPDNLLALRNHYVHINSFHQAFLFTHSLALIYRFGLLTGFPVDAKQAKQYYTDLMSDLLKHPGDKRTTLSQLEYRAYQLRATSDILMMYAHGELPDNPTEIKKHKTFYHEHIDELQRNWKKQKKHSENKDIQRMLKTAY